MLGTMAVKRELSRSQHDCNRRSQIVRGVRRKLAKARDGGFEPREQLVPSDSKVLHLILRQWDRKPLRQIADPYAQSSPRHAVYGRQGTTAQKVAAYRRQDQKPRHEKEECVAILSQNIGFLVQGTSDVKPDHAAV